MRIVGVVPAAGRATRLQPLDRSKEVLQLGGRPVFEYVVERMRAGGAREIRLVTRPEKTDVASAARAAGIQVLLGHPPNAAASISLALEALAPEDVVLLGYPDTIWHPEDGFARVVELLLSEDANVVLGLFSTADLTRSDVVVCDPGGRVITVAVKPDDPPSDVIWGCAAARVGALEGLSEVEAPGYLFDRLARTGSVRGLFLSDSWIDIGTPEGLRAARGRGTKDVGTADTVRRRGRT